MISPEAPAIDEDLEFEIDNAVLHLSFAKTPNLRRMWWDILKKRIDSRSPEAVAELERLRFGKSFG